MIAGIEEKYSQLYNYCYFKLHNSHLAEDITQEAFLRLFENSRYKEIKNPLAFLYTVARNFALTIKPITINAKPFSNTVKRKL